MPDSSKKQEVANAPPRGRRRRKDARPGELIEAGLLEFAEKGFAAARKEDVATRAGVAKGTIYLYFVNKEALFMAAVRSKILPVVENVQEIVGNFPGNTESLLRVVVRTMYDRLVSTDARVLLRILISEGPRFPALLEFYHTNLIQVSKGLIRKILQRGVERESFVPICQSIHRSLSPLRLLLRRCG
jgi:AcrR family transcriptional regulator